MLRFLFQGNVHINQREQWSPKLKKLVDLRGALSFIGSVPMR